MGDVAVLIWHDSPNDKKALVGLKRGLAALGLAASVREMNVDRDASLAKRRLEACDRGGTRCVVALGTRAAQLAKEHIRRIPVIFTAVTNPVLSGIAASWDGSGTNVAGNSNWLDRREMLAAFRLAVPELGRLCVLTSRDNAVSRAEVIEAREALASAPGMTLARKVVEDMSDLPRVLAEALREADAIWVPIDFQLYQEKPLALITSEAAKARIPVVSSTGKCAGAGALVVVTVDYEALGLKAASIVKRVLLKGEDPGRIPIGRMSGARIYVDLAAARRIERKVSLDLVLDAYRVYGGERKE